MRYYKRIKDSKYNLNFNNYYQKDKIYEGSHKRPGASFTLQECDSELIEEVPAGEYFVQEGKMPEYFAIKRVEGNPLWGKYINWLNRTYNENWGGIYNKYYGYDGSAECNSIAIYRCFSNFQNNPAELTLEQWDQIVNKSMKKEFILPEKWAVKRTPKNAGILNDWANNQPDVRGTSSKDGWIHSINYGFMGHSNSGHYYADDIKHPDHTEITFEQFEKYVLNKENMKIIGYKFKEGLFDTKNKSKNTWLKNIASFGLIHDQMENPDESEILKAIFENGLVRSHFEKAGVFDLWFEEVYEEVIPNITIKGYKAEFTDNSVKFGCQKYSKDFVITLSECLEENNFKMDYRDDIKQIAEYFINKK